MTSDRKSLPIVALSTGDPGGIGPEICLKAAVDSAVLGKCRPVLFGDPIAIDAHHRVCNVDRPIITASSIGELDWREDAIHIVAREQFSEAPFQIGAVNAQNGQAAIDSGRAAIRAALSGELHAVAGAPNDKTAINLAGYDYDGYTSLIAWETGLAAEDIFMMLCVDGVNIAHCTLHTSVRRAVDLITEARVDAVIKATHDTLTGIGRPNPRLLVSGLNPHAGEGGLFGDEEREIIEPAIEAARAEGINVEGPVPADLMLHRDGYDAFIMMLHDQGHVPAKVIARHGTAATFMAASLLMTSVAHGTAHDIAGKGRADATAMIEAVNWIAGG